MNKTTNNLTLQKDIHEYQRRIHGWLINNYKQVRPQKTFKGALSCILQIKSNACAIWANPDIELFITRGIKSKA